MPQKVYIFSFKLLELSMWRGTSGRAIRYIANL
jgi:hypothetical protein